MSVPLVEITRGLLTESRHRGDIAVVDGRGRLLARAGDPDVITYFRSAAKPIQALEVILSGAADRYGLDDRELAVICSSHYGEDAHRQAVQSILDKIGLDTSALRCGSPPSIKTEYALEAARRGLASGPLFSDCSGKHAGMLAVCRHLGYDILGYESPEHPLQRKLLKLVSQLCGIEEERIAIGIDGCSVPVFALPLKNMALGYARLARPETLAKEFYTAAERITRAMASHPQMISGTPGPLPGTWGFCSELIRHGRSNIIAKLGAEGVYCVGVKDRGLGLALKIEDGNTRAIHPVVLKILEDLKILDADQSEALDAFRHKKNYNDHGQVIGEYLTVFELQSD
jgi:L-asparaginase II